MGLIILFAVLTIIFALAGVIVGPIFCILGVIFGVIFVVQQYKCSTFFANQESFCEACGSRMVSSKATVTVVNSDNSMSSVMACVCPSCGNVQTISAAPERFEEYENLKRSRRKWLIRACVILPIGVLWVNFLSSGGIEKLPAVAGIMAVLYIICKVKVYWA